MVIDKIGNTGKIPSLGSSKPNKRGSDQKASGGDSVSISMEAQKAQKTATILNTIKKAPDIRREKIDMVKEKMAEGHYENDPKMLEKVAEKIAQALLR